MGMYSDIGFGKTNKTRKLHRSKLLVHDWIFDSKGTALLSFLKEEKIIKDYKWNVNVPISLGVIEKLFEKMESLIDPNWKVFPMGHSQMAFMWIFTFITPECPTSKNWFEKFEKRPDYLFLLRMYILSMAYDYAKKNNYEYLFIKEDG